MGVRSSFLRASVAACLMSSCAPTDGEIDPTDLSGGGASGPGLAQSAQEAVVTYSTLWLTQRGGTGGAPVTMQCGPGDVAVGIYGRQGNSYFSQLGLICAPLYANGTLGPHYTTNSAGPAGNVGYVECPAGYAFIGLNTQSATYLDTIVSINCRATPNLTEYPIKGVRVNSVSYSFGGASRYDGCPTGYAITAMIVRAGSWIDSEQPRCSYVQP